MSASLIVSIEKFDFAVKMENQQDDLDLLLSLDDRVLETPPGSPSAAAPGELLFPFAPCIIRFPHFLRVKIECSNIPICVSVSINQLHSRSDGCILFSSHSLKFL